MLNSLIPSSTVVSGDAPQLPFLMAGNFKFHRGKLLVCPSPRIHMEEKSLQPFALAAALFEEKAL